MDAIFALLLTIHFLSFFSLKKMVLERKNLQEAEDHLNVENKCLETYKIDTNVYDTVFCY